MKSTGAGTGYACNTDSLSRFSKAIASSKALSVSP